MKLVHMCATLLLFLAALALCGCEEYGVCDELNSLFKRNDLGISMKVRRGGYEMEKAYDSNSDTVGLRIEVSGEFSLRGTADIVPGKRYRLTVALKNVSADPVINYSFWKEPKTSLRHYTFNGEDTNPPTSQTQQQHGGYTTFEEVFETREGEDSIQITLHSHQGVFYLKDMNIEELED